MSSFDAKNRHVDPIYPVASIEAEFVEPDSTMEWRMADQRKADSMVFSFCRRFLVGLQL